MGEAALEARRVSEEGLVVEDGKEGDRQFNNGVVYSIHGMLCASVVHSLVTCD